VSNKRSEKNKSKSYFNPVIYRKEKEKPDNSWR